MSRGYGKNCCYKNNIEDNYNEDNIIHQENYNKQICKPTSTNSSVPITTTFYKRRQNQPAHLVLSGPSSLWACSNEESGSALVPSLTSISESSYPSTKRRRSPMQSMVTSADAICKVPIHKIDIPVTMTSVITPPITHVTSTNLSNIPVRTTAVSNVDTPFGWEARRHSSVFARRGTTSLHFHGCNSQLELGDRTGSKLTLDEELYDILYAFGEAFGDGEAEEDEDADEKRVGDKPVTRQYLLNKIRQKKEVINKLRCQPWSMNRKRRTLRLAQKYLEQNESKVSRAHLYKEELVKRWRAFLRWASNIGIYLIPWESKIKKIESQFGSVVSSYFTFLRWVIFMNLILTLIIASLVVIPEVLADTTADSLRRNRTFTRKEIPAEEKPHSDQIQVVWHYGGYLRYSPLFYGYYASEDIIGKYFRYPIPLAYFIGTLVVFACSFIAILRKMALNARMSKLAGSKTEQYIFNWKVFTGWDYSIGNPETASNAAMAAVIKLRETINECHAEQSKKIRPVQVFIRIITNFVILGMIAFSIYCIHAAVQSSEAVEQTGSGSLLTKNQELDEGVLFPKSSIVPSVVSTITHVFPIIFDLIGKIEKHHPKMQLRLHLFRVLTLYVINYATLIFALFEKLDNIRDITRTFDDDERTYAIRRPRRVTMPISSNSFFSRNFSSKGQLKRFLRRDISFAHSSIRLKNSTQMINKVGKWPFDEAVTPVLPHIIVAGEELFGKRIAGQKPKLQSWSRRKRQTSVIEEPSFLQAAVSDTTASFTSQSHSRSSTSPTSSPFSSTWSTTKPRWRSTASLSTSFTKASSKMADRNMVTVDGNRVIINAQFGPIGVNNPTILMRNATVPPTTVSVGYETRRIGPTPLPVFIPPPLPPTEAQPIFRKHDWGPDWSVTTKEKTELSEFPSISFGDVVKLDTVSYSELNDNDLQSGENEDELNGSAVHIISSAEVGDQGHYNDHICWETVIGQEIVKLVTMDLYYTIVSILVIDFFRGYWIRYCSSWWCWDIETTFPEYGEFKVAENVLHIINNQGMVWLGLFFAPLLPAVNNVKLIIIMYIRAWACMTCNVPAREIFRASRSSNFFLMILLLWLLLCTLPVGYVITSKRPSTICGPFAGKDQFYEVITEIIEAHVSKKVIRWLKYAASPGVIIPIILLLMLIIFFLVSLVRGLREANTDLQKQLVHERTEEKKKIFELAGGKKQKKLSTSFFSKFQPKKPTQYIPDVERKRREPWRQYNGTERNASLCPSDEPNSVQMSESDSPITQPSITRPPQLRSTRSVNLISRSSSSRDADSGGNLAPLRSALAYAPSLGSVEEGESNSAKSSTPAINDTRWNERVNMKMSQSVSAARSALTDRVDDFWMNENNATHSDDSDDMAIAGDAQPGAQPPNVSTPDDLRSFILPFLEPRKFHAGDSITSLAAFPKDASNPIIFGTLIAAGGGSGAASRRSSATNHPPSNASYTSLYENSQPNADEHDSDAASPSASDVPSPPEGMTMSEYGALTQWNPRYSKVWRHQYSLAAALPPRPPPSSASASSISQYAAAVLRANRSEMSRSGTFPSGFNNVGTVDASGIAAMTRSFAAHPHASTIPPGGQPAPETQQRISIYAKEPRRFGQMNIQQTELSGSRINTTVNVHDNPKTQTQSHDNKKRNTNKNEAKSYETPESISRSRKPDSINLSMNTPSTSMQKPKERSPTLSSIRTHLKSPTKKFNANEMTEEFVPWPSIEEVKMQRAKLSQNKDKNPIKRESSPPKSMTKSDHSAALSKDRREKSIAYDSDHDTTQPTRFRISVSPTRRLRPEPGDNSSEEEEAPRNLTQARFGSPSKTRFIIKQQLMPGSTSSFGSRISTETTAAMRAEIMAQAAKRMAAATASANASRRQAPRIEFGEDDSPRVEFPPNLP